MIILVIKIIVKIISIVGDYQGQSYLDLRSCFSIGIAILVLVYRNSSMISAR